MDTATHEKMAKTEGIVFSPEVEREWQELRQTIQEEYRMERRETLFKAVGVIGSMACAVWVLYSGLSFITG